jgi:hypothetical protein
MIFGYRIRSRFIGAISFRIRVRLFLELELGPFSLRLNEIFILEKFFFFYLGLDFELDDDLFRGVVLRIY